jgi:hypothetical protein
MTFLSLKSALKPFWWLYEQPGLSIDEFVELL